MLHLTPTIFPTKRYHPSLNFRSLPTQDDLSTEEYAEFDQNFFNLSSLPTQDDLPYEDNDNMETERHKKQMELLIHSLQPWLDQRQRGYVSGNMFIYYSPRQIRSQDFKGPDVFVVADAVPGERKSWVVWDEGRRPDVVIELLSETTAHYDQTQKKLIYQNQLQAPEYFWFDPFNPIQWAGFRLTGGVYKKLRPTHGRLLSHSLGLALTLWDGVYQSIHTTWLRWATITGELLLLPEEAAEQRAQAAAQWAQAAAQWAQVEAQRAQVAEQRAQAAEAEIARLKALLGQQT